MCIMVDRKKQDEAKNEPSTCDKSVSGLINYPFAFLSFLVFLSLTQSWLLSSSE